MFSFGLQVCVAFNKHFAHYPSTFDRVGEPMENNKRRLSDTTMFTYVYLTEVLRAIMYKNLKHLHER